MLKRSNKLMAPLSLLVIAAVMLAACTPATPSATQTTAPTKAPEPTPAPTGPIKIAIMGPFTGDAASIGTEQLNFARLAVADFNKEMGMNVELVEGDTQLDPAIATTVAQKLVADKDLYAVVGPAGSQEVEATIQLFEDAKLAHVSSSATRPTLTSSGYTTFFRVFFIGTTFFVTLASAHFVRERLRHAGEYYALLILSTIGAIYMAAARELLTAYISLELLSFSLYILVSYAKFDPKSNEGGLKYMLLGAFSSALLLYGLSLIYGVAGSTTYSEIGAALSAGTEDFSFALLMGLVLVLAGLGFKVAAVPFHMWTPDAYEGAPLPITAYLSAASKAAGFALLLRLF